MNFKEFYKELNDKKIMGLFFPSYVIKKPIFYTWLFIILLIGFSIVFVEGYNSETGDFVLFDNSVYLTCSDKVRPCENPFYLQSPCFPKDKYICEVEFINPGQSLGSPPKTELSNYFGFIILVFFVVALLLNHFIFNRNYDFKKQFEGDDLK